MYLHVTASQRSFSVELHWAILDSADFLVAASFGGIGTAVKAVSAAMIEGRSTEIVMDDRTRRAVHLSRGDYRKVERQVDTTAHGVILQKAAVYEENKSTPIVIAIDGNVKKAIGDMLAARYALPQIWRDQYLCFIPEEMMEEMEVLVNPLSPMFQHLKAVRFTTALNEEFILNEVEARLKDGRLLIPQIPVKVQAKFDPSWDMKEYLKQNAEVLAMQLEEVKPRHDPRTGKVDPAIAELKRIPFPAQAAMIQGLLNTLKHQNSVFLAGDMGTGKTITALGLAYSMWKYKLTTGKSGMRVLFAVPGITIPKWANLEIPETLPDAKVRILNCTDDAILLLREVRSGKQAKGLECVIVGTDRAKLGPEPWGAAIWKRVPGMKYKSWHCPQCGQSLPHPDYKPEEGEDEVYATWDVMAEGLSPEESGGYFEIVDIPKFGQDPDKVLYKRTANGFPVGFKVKWDRKSKLKKCQNCGSKLWRPALKSRGETQNRPRWFICRILKKLRGAFALFVQDEVQQVKAENSGRGDSFAQLVKSAKKTLALTGTLVNGKSTSIKETLWRTDPKALLDEGFTHKTGALAWADRFGVLERVTRVDDMDAGIVTRKKQVEMQPVEKPGIAPEMTAHFLLHKSGFMELGDLNLPLVQLREIPVFVDLDPVHGSEYTSFHNRLHEICRKMSARGSRGAWAKFNPSTINYADRPDMGSCVVFNDGEEVVAAPAFPADYYHAKERRLVEIVKQELAEDRGIVIYATYTDFYGVHHRIRDVLAVHGIKAEVMESTVNPEKRIDWLQGQGDKGTKVIICNMTLVEVGLDLLAYPSIMYFQSSYNINTIRQSSRRSWRVGQHRECRVYYMVYNGTQQMSQFANIMLKRSHAMLVEGRIDRSELAQFARDKHNALAADLADCLASSDLAQRWQALAAKDMDAHLNLVSEADFKQAIREAQAKLVEETLRMCGRQAKINLTEPTRLFGLAGVSIEIKEVEVKKRGKETGVVQLAFGF
ncbi:MAG: hypothetical protein ACYCX4_00025 [Bacillota bacterium]